MTRKEWTGYYANAFRLVRTARNAKPTYGAVICTHDDATATSNEPWKDGSYTVTINCSCGYVEEWAST